MSHAQMLSAVGLIRTSRRRGFCPACRLFQTGDAPQEMTMAAMMLPSAMPLVFEFARNAEDRRGWQAATALLGATYRSAGLMLAIVLIGMSNLVWMIVLTAVILMYKLAAAPGLRRMLAPSAAIVALGVLYAATA